MAKKEKPSQSPAAGRDDALFEALGKNKKRRKRKILLTVVSAVLVLAIVAVLTVGSLRQQVQDKFGTDSGEVLSYQVTTGSISTLVSGTGNLTDVDLEAVTVPEGVEITDVPLEVNQTVAKGDILARVDMASVARAMAELQVQLQELDAQIREAAKDTADTAVTAGIGGRVKAIFAGKDDNVADVMCAHGALAILSLDGYLSVTVETDALAAGDHVTVRLAGGKEISGTVETAALGTATVLVTDNGPEYGQDVTVLTTDGGELASGRLEIHSPLRITGYAGTVSAVNTTVNARVSSATRLFTLKDTGCTARYETLLRQRTELEETLLELLTIQRSGAVLAHMEGSVFSVDHGDTAPTAVATLSPDKTVSVTVSVDESDILALEPGQTVSVTVSSVREEPFEGTLTEIQRTGTSGTYSAEIRLPKAEGMLSGMTAEVDVRIQGVEDALLIPVDALHKTRDGAYVYTGYDEALGEYVGRVEVVTGLENSQFVQIRSGLKAGDTVYYTEQNTAYDFFNAMSGGRPGGMGGMTGGNGGMGGGMGGNNGGGRPGGFGGQG